MIRCLLMATFAVVLCFGLFAGNAQSSELSTSFVEKMAKQTDSKPYDSLAKALQNSFKKSDSTTSVKNSKASSSSKYSQKTAKTQKSKVNSAKKTQKSYAKKARSNGNQSKSVAQKAKSYSKKAKNYKTSYNKH